MNKQRYAPHGVLAVVPKAFGALFDENTDTQNQIVDGVESEGVDAAIVPIRGPLMHHADYCFDSYESIVSRVAQAIAAGARTVVLDIDSPGGLVSGAFDTSRELRAMCKTANVNLRAHVTGQCASAAYALATAADFIGVSRSASIGSIGVIDTMVDASAQNAAQGVSVHLITSGERKSDGNPNVPMTDAAMAAAKGRVDTLAAMFFDLVAEHGYGGSVEQIAGMQAALFVGEESVKLNLTSAVATLAQTIAFDALCADAQATETEREKAQMATPMEDAVASLRSAAEGDDKEVAKNARAALAALGEDVPAAEGDEDESAAEGDKDETAEGDEDETAEGDEDETAAEGDEDETSALAVASAALAAVHTMKAEAASAKRATERANLLASRPDFAPELVKVLKSKATPLATVRSMVKDLPKGPTRKDAVAAVALATGTRGASQNGSGVARLGAAEKAELDAQMGLTQMTAETVNSDLRLTFGARRPLTAAEVAAKAK